MYGHGCLLYPCEHVEFSVEVYGHGCMLYPCEHVEFSVEYMAMVVCYTLANTWNLVWSIWPWLYVLPLQTRGI